VIEFHVQDGSMLYATVRLCLLCGCARASENVRVTRETTRERNRARERWGVAASKLRISQPLLATAVRIVMRSLSRRLGRLTSREFPCVPNDLPLTLCNWRATGLPRNVA
jgi:hypothetical protein